MDSKQINILKSESKRFKWEQIRSRGNPNGRPYGQKPKDTMQDAVWSDNDAGGLLSRKFVDHSKNRQRRLFMTDEWVVHRIRFCKACAEGFMDPTPYNRNKFEKQRRKNKKITRDMLDF